MKKTVSLLLAALLVLSAFSFAMADDKTTIVIGATPSPHREVLDYFERHSIRIYRTDLQSDIVVRCYEEGYRIDTAA